MDMLGRDKKLLEEKTSCGQKKEADSEWQIRQNNSSEIHTKRTPFNIWLMSFTSIAKQGLGIPTDAEFNVVCQCPSGMVNANNA